MPSNRKISRRKFLTLAAGTVVGGGTGGLAYVFRIEPGWVEISEVELTLPRLAPAFDGYRIAQLSDIHLDNAWMTEERLTDLVAQTVALAADAVVITGDFVSRGDIRPLEDVLARRLAPLAQSPDGAAAVLGNHDYWTNAAIVRSGLRRAGITNVSNGVMTVQRGDDLLHIAGVDDVWERHNRLEDVLALLPDDGAAILLAHEPDFADISAATGRFDLQVSGHSHGGQANFPFIGRPILPYLGQKYPAGLYIVGNMFQYTNRGVGMVNPQARFNCRPEITVYTLKTGLRTED